MTVLIEKSTYNKKRPHERSLFESEKNEV